MMKFLLYGFLTALVITGIGLLLVDYKHRMVTYNAHVCAVNGYYPDCETQLPEDKRLK